MIRHSIEEERGLARFLGFPVGDSELNSFEGDKGDHAAKVPRSSGDFPWQ